jgi:L-ascorbate metabolism protein UlaG (beta-lactamase superfamily)
MKKIGYYTVLIYVLIMTGNGWTMTAEDMVKNIHWLGQAAVRIDAEGGKAVYIDPYQIKGTGKADIVLITHAHSDHLSINDINRVIKEDTVFVAPPDCAAKIKAGIKKDVIVIAPGDTKIIKGINIEAVPAYNITKAQNHPKSNKWAGYIISTNGIRIYHAGDTERIPEMKNFNVDIAMLPLGQTYTMNSVKDAADAVLDTKAKIAIPIHFGMYEGTKKDAETFAGLLKGKVTVVIKNIE